jgi:hypothetical protein
MCPHLEARAVSTILLSYKEKKQKYSNLIWQPVYIYPNSIACQPASQPLPHHGIFAMFAHSAPLTANINFEADDAHKHRRAAAI